MVQKGDSQMNFSQDELAVIKELEKLHTSDLIEQIKRISHAAWNGYLEIITLKAWLENFTGECLNSVVAEKNLALWLAQHFVFYNENDITTLSVNLWWKYIHHQVDHFDRAGFMNECSLDEKLSYILENTVVQPLGNCAGSGTNTCYFLRQANGLKKAMFDIDAKEIYRYLVLVDDATVSGYQAEENLRSFSSIDKEKYIITFISTKEACDHIGNSAHIISSIEMDEKSKCFHEDSYVFSRHKNWIPIAKKMCKYYGKKCNPRDPLGYRKGEYLFGFYYNTPNNTLPIFWATLGGWTPLFNRFFSESEESEGENKDAFV